MLKDAYGNYISGQWVESGDLNQSLSPSDLEDRVGAYARAGREQTEQAIAAVRVFRENLKTAYVRL